MRESKMELSDEQTEMLGVHSVSEAVAIAIEYGIIGDDQILENYQQKITQSCSRQMIDRVVLYYCKQTVGINLQDFLRWIVRRLCLSSSPDKRKNVDGGSANDRKGMVVKMKRYKIAFVLCLSFLFVFTACENDNSQAENYVGDKASSKQNATIETVDEVTTKLFEQACDLLQIERSSEYQQIAGDDQSYRVLKFFNTGNEDTSYLYLDLQAKEVFLIPFYGEAVLKSANPSEIIFDVEGYSKEEDMTKFPYKLTCLKLDKDKYDFYEGFYRVVDNYWVSTSKDTQFGTTYDKIDISQITVSSYCVQLLFDVPVSTTGMAPLQKITFDATNGLCEIREFNCSAIPESSIFVPESSYIKEVKCEKDGKDCVIAVRYDASVADAYKADNSVYKNGMPITEIRFGQSATISPEDSLK